MNTASKQLCAELYKRSGWDDLGDGQLTIDRNNVVAEVRYDLGYLWRKFEELGNEQSVGYDDSGSFWHFHYGSRGTGRQIADIGCEWYSGRPQESIEDAFCEFFIDLFKQGILFHA